MSEGSPDLGVMVSKLLGNPELISQIASTVGMEAGQATENEKTTVIGPEEVKKTGNSAGGADGLLPLLSMVGGTPNHSGGASGRCALLAALKPFCNEHRCKTIDYMIGISRLSETLIPNKRG